MENQIYRLKLSKKKTLEFFIADTNEIEPFKRTKELGIVVIGSNTQLDDELDVKELDSLISFLRDCKSYISEYNEEQSINNINSQQ